MHRLFLCLFLLASCAADKRVYQPPAGDVIASPSAAYDDRSSRQRPVQQPELHAEHGEVLDFFYEGQTGGGERVLGYVGSAAIAGLSGGVVMPFGYLSSGGSHVPTYRIRLANGDVVPIRDPKCPPLVRGSRVALIPLARGGYGLMPIGHRY